MSKKFYATNGQTYWKANPAYKEQKLAMLQDGSLVVLTNMLREGWDVEKLPAEFHYTETPDNTENLEEKVIEKVDCSICRGTGEVDEIVDHDEDYNSVWAMRQCFCCNGTGKVVKK